MYWIKFSFSWEFRPIKIFSFPLSLSKFWSLWIGGCVLVSIRHVHYFAIHKFVRFSLDQILCAQQSILHFKRNHINLFEILTHMLWFFVLNNLFQYPEHFYSSHKVIELLLKSSMHFMRSVSGVDFSMETPISFSWWITNLNESTCSLPTHRTPNTLHIGFTSNIYYSNGATNVEMKIAQRH